MGRFVGQLPGFNTQWPKKAESNDSLAESHALLLVLKTTSGEKKNIHRTKKQNKAQTREVLKWLGKSTLEFEDFDNLSPGLLPSHFHSTQLSQGLAVP